MRREYSIPVFCALLSLYPRRFRARFGEEMVQVFRDCNDGSIVFWLRTFGDFAISLPREWQREVADPDSEIDYPGLADSVMLSMVVGANLLGLGSMAALMVFAVVPAVLTHVLDVMTFTICIVIGALWQPYLTRKDFIKTTVRLLP